MQGFEQELLRITRNFYSEAVEVIKDCRQRQEESDDKLSRGYKMAEIMYIIFILFSAICISIGLLTL